MSDRSLNYAPAKVASREVPTFWLLLWLFGFAGPTVLIASMLFYEVEEPIGSTSTFLIFNLVYLTVGVTTILWLVAMIRWAPRSARWVVLLIVLLWAFGTLVGVIHGFNVIWSDAAATYHASRVWPLRYFVS